MRIQAPESYIGDPLDIAMTIARDNQWSSNYNDSNLTVDMQIKGEWREYIVTCNTATPLLFFVTTTIKFEPHKRYHKRICELVNGLRVGMLGGFHFCETNQVLLFQTCQVLDESEEVASEVVRGLIQASIQIFDRYLPAFLAIAAGEHYVDALKVSFGEPFGKA